MSAILVSYFCADPDCELCQVNPRRQHSCPASLSSLCLAKRRAQAGRRSMAKGATCSLPPSAPPQATEHSRHLDSDVKGHCSDQLREAADGVGFILCVLALRATVGVLARPATPSPWCAARAEIGHTRRRLHYRDGRWRRLYWRPGAFRPPGDLWRRSARDPLQVHRFKTARRREHLRHVARLARASGALL